VYELPSVIGLVKYVNFSNKIKDIHFKLGILGHYKTYIYMIYKGQITLYVIFVNYLPFIFSICYRDVYQNYATFSPLMHSSFILSSSVKNGDRC
jgi:hypothetical protein